MICGIDDDVSMNTVSDLSPMSTDREGQLCPDSGPVTTVPSDESEGVLMCMQGGGGQLMVRDGDLAVMDGLDD